MWSSNNFIFSLSLLWLFSVWQTWHVFLFFYVNHPNSLFLSYCNSLHIKWCILIFLKFIKDRHFCCIFFIFRVDFYFFCHLRSSSRLAISILFSLLCNPWLVELKSEREKGLLLPCAFSTCARGPAALQSPKLDCEGTYRRTLCFAI